MDPVVITWTTYLIVCPLVFLAGFVDAIAGGGGLISLPAYMMAGLPMHHVLGTNKLSSSMGTTLATYKYARSGYIRWKPALFSIVCALAGSSIGAHLALLTDPYYFKIFILFLLPVTAYYVMKGKSFSGDREPYTEKKTILIAMACAFFIGIYDGFYGPGTGTFLLLLLAGTAHMKLTEANGVSKAINLTTNYTALAVFFMNDTIIFPLGLTAGVFNILGNWLGTIAFKKGGIRTVKPIIILVLVLFFIKTLNEMI
jgi:uncharacterized protein